MTGGHGVSLKPCSEVNYAFRKRVVIDNLEHCAQFENILQSQVHGWKAKN